MHHAHSLPLVLAVLSACATHATQRGQAVPTPGQVHESESQPASNVEPPASALEGKLPAPAHFPPEAREMMRARMIRHGESMTYLMAGVIFLAYDDARSIAFDIAKEPKLGRPAEGEKDTLNALLPVLFFDLQDQLAARARELAESAEARDNARLVKAFGALAETCVACHAAYLADVESAGDASVASE